VKFNKLIPELIVSDIKKSLEFYTKILGFKIEYQREEDKFAFLSLDGAQLMLEENLDSAWNTGKLEKPFGKGINLQIEVKDVQSLIDSLDKNKHPLKIPLKENWYRKGKVFLGNKEFLVMDPDGYLLRFSQDIGKRKLE
jgi:catechol 2,3-dioxygenase-like lactoylglutathione lyase family enzyme